jgi:hypothetical protein
MKHRPEIKIHPLPAPCQGARRLLTVAVIAGMLAVLATAADWLLRVPHQDDAARVWMNALTLSAAALHPAGTPIRHPETMHPAVDLRFSPGLETAP